MALTAYQRVGAPPISEEAPTDLEERPARPLALLRDGTLLAGVPAGTNLVLVGGTGSTQVPVAGIAEIVSEDSGDCQVRLRDKSTLSGRLENGILVLTGDNRSWRLGARELQLWRAAGWPPAEAEAEASKPAATPEAGAAAETGGESAVEAGNEGKTTKPKQSPRQKVTP